MTDKAEVHGSAKAGVRAGPRQKVRHRTSCVTPPYKRRWRNLLGAALAILVASAGADVSPAAASAQSPADEGEFVRLTEELNRRQEAGDVTGAVAAIGLLVPLGERVLGAADPDYLAMLARIGEYLADHQRSAEALPVMERLLAGREASVGADHPDTLTALIYLSAAHFSRGDYARAEPLVVRALATAERVRGPEHPDTLTALNNLGVLRLEQGRHSDAEPLLQRALTSRDRILGRDNGDTIESLSALAWLYFRQGRLDEAEPMVRLALDTRERLLGARDPFTISSMNALAQLVAARGEYGPAGALFERAAAASLAVLGENHPYFIDAVEGQAVALVMTGKFGEAEPLARQALAARERLQGVSHPATIRSTSVLANLYLATDRPREAEPLLVRAMADSEQRLGQEHPDFLLAAENVLFARLTADPANPNALEPGRKLLAGARARRGSRSANLYGQLQAGRERRGRSRARWYTMFADAALAAGNAQAAGHGQPDSNPQLLAEVFLALQEAVAGEASASIARMAVRRYVERRGDDLGALVREREDLSERWLALSESISYSFSAGGDEAERERLREELQATEVRVEAIDARLGREFPEYFTLIQPQPVQGPDAQRLLRDDEAVLIAVPGEFGTHAMVFTRGGAQWARSDWTHREVKAAVDRLRYDVGAQVEASADQIQAWEADRPAGERMSFDRATAFALYLSTVQPVERLLAGKKRIYIVAGESLAGLPFSLLVTAPPQGADDDPAALRGTSWLAERYELVHVPSVQALGFLRGAARSGPRGQGFIGFGDPALAGRAATRGMRRGAAVPAAEQVITRTRAAWGGAVANVGALRQMQQLPGTARELQAMSEMFGRGSSRLFTQASATETQVYETDLSQARVIAFATHGLTPSDPIGDGADGVGAGEMYELAEPGLVLTPPAEASERDDGFLSASEVTSLRLDADWVILSACNTATGDAATAGLSQLARAFFYAGARNLLASHWPVDDDVAAQITVRTLALEQAGTARAAAFQQAMREIRNDSAHGDWAHPFYWAPFVLIGDGG